MVSVSEKSDGSNTERGCRDGHHDDGEGSLSKEIGGILAIPPPPSLARSTSRGSYAIDAEAQVAPEESEQNPPPVKVPRSARRGLLGKLAVLAEVEEPKHYPDSVKWFITFVIAVAAMAAPLGSTILFRRFTPCYDSRKRDSFDDSYQRACLKLPLSFTHQPPPRTCL